MPRPRPAYYGVLLALFAVSLWLCACGSDPAPEMPAQAAGGAPPAADVQQIAAVAQPSAEPPRVLDAAAEQASTESAVTTPAKVVCPPAEPGQRTAPVKVRTAPPPPIGAAAAVVVDGGSGEVLWGWNEHAALPPASTTKIVTALLAVEQGNLDALVHVQVDDRRFEVGTRMGLVQGDVFPLRDLLYGLMLPSGNDAAIVIAQHLAGSEAAFARQMNQRLCELGLVDSTFINASGLGRGESNLASAHDLAQVARRGMELPEFARLAGATAWTARGSRTLPLRNLNELLGAYPGADGVKIGWTPGAGHTIVASASRNAHRVIVVLLNTPSRARESAALLDWAFANFAWGDRP